MGVKWIRLSDPFGTLAWTGFSRGIMGWPDRDFRETRGKPRGAVQVNNDHLRLFRQVARQHRLCESSPTGRCGCSRHRGGPYALDKSWELGPWHASGKFSDKRDHRFITRYIRPVSRQRSGVHW